MEKIILKIKRILLLVLILLGYSVNIIAEHSIIQKNDGVTGIVSDKMGPMTGVTVMVKGTQNGVITDLNGEFAIDAKKGDVLVVDFVGYTSREITVGDSKKMNVILQEDVKTLSEVVVVGYGTQKKETLTGAVAAIKSADIVTTKNENVQNMLTGKVAGLQVVQKSSEPGKFDNSFSIRGMGDPLVIIDGVPRDNMSRIDPNDIANVSILKDASAAVYGVRAANGVVLITTKQGRKGKLSLNYSGTMGWQVPSGMPKTLGAIDFMTLDNEKQMRNVNGGTPKYLPADFDAYKSGQRTSTDWYNAVFAKSAPQQQHNISASGGDDKTTYFISMGYQKQDGLFVTGNPSYERFSVRSNVTSKITDRLTINLDMSGISDNTTGPGVPDGSWYVIRSFWSQIPTDPIFANNNHNYYRNPTGDKDNPVQMLDKSQSGYTKNTNKWFQTNMSISYKVPKVEGLESKFMFSYDYNNEDKKTYFTQYHDYTYDQANDTYVKHTTGGQNGNNLIRRDYYARENILWNASLNYKRVFAKKHDVKALLLMEESGKVGDDFYAQRAVNLPVDQLIAGNADGQQGYMDPDGLYHTANIGFVGRFNYTFSDKYLAELGFRYDGSSKFPSNSRWALFPSLSLGWRLSEENFWKNNGILSKIDNFKLRASYGKMGDDGASSYQYVGGYTYPASGKGNGNNERSSGSVFGGTFTNGAASKGITNPNISWYVAKTADFGVDAEVWHGLLGFSFDWFQRERTDLLAQRAESLPAIVGADLPQENLEGDRTRGYDLEITHRQTLGDFSYNVKAIISFANTQNRYRVRAIDGNSQDNWRNGTIYRDQNLFWGYGSAGHYTSWEDIANSPTMVDKSTLPGDYKYQDWNGDGIVSDLDKHVLGRLGNPLYNYGLSLGGAYKNFDLNMLWQGAGGNDVAYDEQLRIAGWGGGNYLTQYMDRWHPVNPNADPYDRSVVWVPGKYAYTGNDAWSDSQFNLQDASYVRLKSIEIGYTLPVHLLKKIGIKSLRVYTNGYNILTFTKVKYVDPEHPTDSYGYVYPMNKTYSVGVSAKF